MGLGWFCFLIGWFSESDSSGIACPGLVEDAVQDTDNDAVGRVIARGIGLKSKTAASATEIDDRKKTPGKEEFQDRLWGLQDAADKNPTDEE